MHRFSKVCIDHAELARATSVKDFLAKLLKQSNRPEAQLPYHESQPQTDEVTGAKILAPRYFGAGGEFFAEVFFQVYGHRYNIAEVNFTDDAARTGTDTGVDAYAKSVKEQKLLSRRAAPGTMVYVQVKTALNPMKDFTTNDGSRIMNFFANAQAHALCAGESYQARYVLWTTGNGLHWCLEQNTYKLIEVINYREIHKLTKGDHIFWNAFRIALGQPPKLMSNPLKDPEFEPENP